MRSIDDLLQTGDPPLRLSVFAFHATAASLGIFLIFAAGDYFTGSFGAWPLQLAASFMVGSYVAVANRLERDAVREQHVLARSGELMELSERLTYLSAADFSVFAALSEHAGEDVISITGAGSGGDSMWRALVRWQWAAPCDPGAMEAAAPSLRRYTLTAKGRAGLPLAIGIAHNRRVEIGGEAPDI